MTSDPSKTASWRILRNLATADSSPSIAQVCDPKLGPLSDSIRRAKLCTERSASFELKLATYLQTQCLAEHIHLPMVLRGLEVLEAFTEEANLLTVLRFFLRSSIPQIASKSVLILGRRCQRSEWMKQVMSEADDRVRANLIESLWGRAGHEEIKSIFQDALRDQHHRVAANAAYGLFLSGNEEHKTGIDQLTSNNDPACRRAGIWVIKSIGSRQAVARLKDFIRDQDAAVRRAAFGAIAFLRERRSPP